MVWGGENWGQDSEKHMFRLEENWRKFGGWGRDELSFLLNRRLGPALMWLISAQVVSFGKNEISNREFTELFPIPPHPGYLSFIVIVVSLPFKLLQISRVS